MQFVLTENMRTHLAELGYSAAEIDGLQPRRAAAIIQSSTPSSRIPQAKPKTKPDRFELRFTCNVCDALNSHSISRHAYTKGTVIVTCPGCNSTHLIADHLNWIEDDFKNLEEAMAKRGVDVKRVVNDGVAASAASAAMSSLLEEEGEQGDASEAEPPQDEPPAPSRIDGIDEDQALRIREAVRAAKRRKREQES